MNMNELSIACRTIRRFRQEPVPDELLRDMVENARIAASGQNRQPLRYAIVRSPEMVARMQPLVRWAGALPKEIGTPKEGEQPTAFVVIAKTDDAISFSDIDVGIACDRITMTAREHGYGACILGAINVNAIKELTGLEGCTVRIAVALGKPACESTIVDMPASGDFKYYVDKDRNYYVPKRAFDDIAKFL